MGSISILPNEILSQIIENTEHDDYFEFSVVNRKFNQMITPLLYQNIYIKDQDQANDFFNCISIPKEPIGKWINYIHLKDFTVTDHQLLTLMEHTPMLQSLVISDASHLSDRVVQHTSHAWQHLNTLDLSHCVMNTEIYRLLVEQCTNLSTLILFRCRGIERDTFGQPQFHNTSLTTLELIDDNNDILIYDLTGLHGLTDLNLNQATFGALYLALMTIEEGFCWPRLTGLTIQDCSQYADDDYLIPLISGFPRLKRLGLQNSVAMTTDTMLNVICQYQPDLIELDLSWCQRITHGKVRRLIRQCRHLSMIRLSYCGLRLCDFPFASRQCGGLISSDHNTFIGLDHLNKDAIDKIRHSDLFG